MIYVVCTALAVFGVIAWRMAPVWTAGVVRRAKRSERSYVTGCYVFANPSRRLESGAVFFDRGDGDVCCRLHDCVVIPEEMFVDSDKYQHYRTLVLKHIRRKRSATNGFAGATIETPHTV